MPVILCAHTNVEIFIAIIPNDVEIAAPIGPKMAIDIGIMIRTHNIHLIAIFLCCFWLPVIVNSWPTAPVEMFTN